MTYEQSLKNIAMLKGFVWPLGMDEGVYVFFRDEKEFEVIFKSTVTLEEIRGRYNQAHRDKAPAVDICRNEDGHLIFFYRDQNFLNYKYNLTREEIICDYIWSYKRNYAQLKLEMAQLITQLKKP